jgi:serine/threonine-protein kinase HipA
VNGKRKDVSKEDLLSVARAMNIKKADKIISEIIDKIKHWNEYAEEAKVVPSLQKAIGDTL